MCETYFPLSTFPPLLSSLPPFNSCLAGLGWVTSFLTDLEQRPLLKFVSNIFSKQCDKKNVVSVSHLDIKVVLKMHEADVVFFLSFFLKRCVCTRGTMHLYKFFLFQ